MTPIAANKTAPRLLNRHLPSSGVSDKAKGGGHREYSGLRPRQA
jgi:hypothetical protein